MLPSSEKPCDSVVVAGKFLIDEQQCQFSAETQLVLAWHGNVTIRLFDLIRRLLCQFGEVRTPIFVKPDGQLGFGPGPPVPTADRPPFHPDGPAGRSATCPLDNPGGAGGGRRLDSAAEAVTREEWNMKFGGMMFFTDYSMSAMELARALVERGFESVWAPEHSHIPLSRKTPYPGGGDLPKPYYDAMDPFVVLAAASQVTRTIKLGTGVLLVQQRDAIQTAKLVASLDQVSQGRFLFGVGGGWNQDEMEDHGTVYASRFKRMREAIEAMKEIWTKSEAEYHGEFVNFDPTIANPKPVQKPHPPIHVGGAFPHAARRAIRYGDGWIPTARGDLAAQLPEFQKMAREAGRDPASLEVTSFGLAEDLDRLKRLKDLGVGRVVPMFPPEKSDKVLPIIDRWTKLMQQVNG